MGKSHTHGPMTQKRIQKIFSDCEELDAIVLLNGGE
jgi:hypothetical protein